MITRPAPAVQALPVSALLSQTLVAFTIEADNEAEHRLPHRTTQLGLSAGAPAGAPWLTDTNLDGMRRWRYVTYTPDPGRGKRPKPTAIVAPTAHGRLAREVWQAVTGDIESRWRSRYGPGAVEGLRAALAAIVTELDPGLPDCLPILGHGLYSRTPAPPEPPAAGPGVSADISALPLWALLSRPLLAFALAYERAGGPSLAVSANVLRVLTEAGLRTRDVPALAGVSKEAVAMAAGLLGQGGLGAEGPDPAGGRFKIIRLSAAGAAGRAEYHARAAGLEDGWRDRFGARRVARSGRRLSPWRPVTRPRFSPPSSPTRTTGAPGSRPWRSSRTTRRPCTAAATPTAASR